MTNAKVELGRHLFYDARISVNGKQSRVARSAG
jgi:cytochrome c peroxidase